MLGPVEQFPALSRSKWGSFDQSLLSKPSKAAMWELRRKLPSVKAQITHKQAIASIYDGILGDLLVSKETETRVQRSSSFPHYPILVDAYSRNRIYKQILGRGYHVGLSPYPNVHEMDGFRRIPGRSGNISNLVRSVLILPTHQGVTEEYARSLAHTVRQIVQAEGIMPQPALLRQ
jgi:perosamine synthetase